MSDIHEGTEHEHVDGNGEWREHDRPFDDTDAHEQLEPKLRPHVRQSSCSTWISDPHTHLFSTEFQSLLRRRIDELVPAASFFPAAPEIYRHWSSASGPHPASDAVETGEPRGEK